MDIYTFDLNDFDSIEDMFLSLLKELNERKEKNGKPNNEVKVNYSTPNDKEVKELAMENGKLREEKCKLHEDMRILAMENAKLDAENKSLKAGPYNKMFYLDTMKHLGRTIVEEYGAWLKLCNALKLDKEEMYDDINEALYDMIPDE